MNFLFDPYFMWGAPLSGDVMQRIAARFFSPSVTVNYAGDSAVEGRVVSEVASFGRQIGWLNDIVLCLAGGGTPSPDMLAPLRQAVDDIARIKAETKQSDLKRAGDALDRLRSAHPADYAALVRAHSERMQR